MMVGMGQKMNAGFVTSTCAFPSVAYGASSVRQYCSTAITATAHVKLRGSVRPARRVRTQTQTDSTTTTNSHTVSPTWSSLAPRLRNRYDRGNLWMFSAGSSQSSNLTEMAAPSESLKSSLDFMSQPKLEIVKYPHPSLRAENENITDFASPELTVLVKKMFAAMYDDNGVGLAAPQVGVNKRVMVFNPKGDAKAFAQQVALVNPRIVKKSAKVQLGPEGCLSFPGMGGDVERHVWVEVQAQRHTNGKKFKVKYTGWEAVIFQHEYDHLDGVVYIDKLSANQREEVQPVLDQLVADFKGPGQPAL
mmetsp:Transcript_10175/g.21327  ORF Transcript_10175/g.21327 Transcript_10175/m.21327 type:complete len:305 (+) Transcript_10175:3-917(+)